MIFISNFWKNLYKTYQNVKNRCFLTDLIIGQKIDQIARANVYNDDYEARYAEENFFNKNSVSGLVGWYSAESEYVSKDASNNVSSWADRSDEGNHLNTTPATQPVWVANAVNGHPAILASGDTYLMRAGITPFTEYCAFLVIKPTVVDKGNADIFLNFIDEGSKMVGKTGSDTSYEITELVGSLVGESMVEDRVDIIMATEDNFFNSEIKRNNNMGTTGVLTEATSSIFMLFNYSDDDNDNAFWGYIAECLIYDTNLGGVDKNLIISYLNWKYNVF